MRGGWKSMAYITGAVLIGNAAAELAHTSLPSGLTNPWAWLLWGGIGMITSMYEQDKKQ